MSTILGAYLQNKWIYGLELLVVVTYYVTLFISLHTVEI